MRLVSCYVTGFGGLNNFWLDFSEGLNALCEENGWGKSTLSAFLEAMFYGIEKRDGRKKLFDDRDRYRPWNQGAYGGNLTFEAKGKRYRIERTFGNTLRTDTFMLIDLTTGMESTDYSENIGEELFEVDRDSFGKTIYVPQLATATTMTGSMSTKMGDLDSAQDDINNFDVAMERIHKAKIKLRKDKTSRVNPGSIDICEKEIRELKDKIDTKEVLYDGYQRQEALLNEKKSQLEILKVKKRQIAELIRKKSEYEKKIGAYNVKRENLSEQERKIKPLDDFFARGIPEMSEQESMEELESQWDLGKRKEMDLAMELPTEQQIHKWENLFASGKPSANDFEEWKSQAQRMQELRLQSEHAKFSEESKQQLNDLQHFFARKIPTESEISEIDAEIQTLSTLEGKIVQQDDTYYGLKEKRDAVLKDKQGKNSRGKVILFAILAIIFAVGGIVIYTMGVEWMVLEIIFDVGAASCLVAALMIGGHMYSLHKKSKGDVESQLKDAKEALKQSREEERERKATIQKFLSHFVLESTENFSQMLYEIRANLDAYHRLLEEEEVATKAVTELGEEMANLQMRLYTPLASFAECYGMDLYHEANETELLGRLTKDASAYEAYLADKKTIELEHASTCQRERLLENYLGRFPFDENIEPKKKLQMIRSNIGNYTRIQGNIATLRLELQQEKPEQLDETDTMTIAECQHEQEECDTQIIALNRAILECNNSLDEFAAQIDEVEEADRTLEEKEDEKNELEKSYKLLELTEQYLRSAKERFLSEYLAPLRERMDYYTELLDEQAISDVGRFTYEMDLDLSVRVMKDGSSHESRYLSAGYQDLVALCTRFALIDVLYHNEQPMIILDDPFTNFDENVIARAINLIKEFSNQRQIIYFTCHESRMP